MTTWGSYIFLGGALSLLGITALFLVYFVNYLYKDNLRNRKLKREELKSEILEEMRREMK